MNKAYSSFLTTKLVHKASKCSASETNIYLIVSFVLYLYSADCYRLVPIYAKMLLLEISVHLCKNVAILNCCHRSLRKCYYGKLVPISAKVLPWEIGAHHCQTVAIGNWCPPLPNGFYRKLGLTSDKMLL